jgi:glycerol-3-phosphate acyltransferase PlsY
MNDIHDIVIVLLAIASSYVLGSVPTGLWLGLTLRKIDIREHGSKNIGATNTMRVLGKKLGAVALIADVSKGIVPVLLIARIGVWPELPLACGVAAVVGHTASIFLRFRGGKGVATGAGAFLALCPVPTLIAAAVFGVVVALTRMVSAGSMSGAVALCAAIYALDASWPLRIAATFVAVYVIWKHRSNIKRILQGVENRGGYLGGVVGGPTR